MAIVALEKQTNISCIGSVLQQVGLKKKGQRSTLVLNPRMLCRHPLSG